MCAHTRARITFTNHIQTPWKKHEFVNFSIFFQRYAQVIQIWANLSKQFPNAELHASSLDAFVEALITNQNISDSLPVLTAEMGDTWNYGIAADPYVKSRLNEVKGVDTFSFT